MDPHSGRLFPSVQDALDAGVDKPVELIGRPEDIERISQAVKALHNKENKKAKRKAVQRSRRNNR